MNVLLFTEVNKFLMSQKLSTNPEFPRLEQPAEGTREDLARLQARAEVRETFGRSLQWVEARSVMTLAALMSVFASACASSPTQVPDTDHPGTMRSTSELEQWAYQGEHVIVPVLKALWYVVSHVGYAAALALIATSPITVPTYLLDRYLKNRSNGKSGLLFVEKLQPHQSVLTTSTFASGDAVLTNMRSHQGWLVASGFRSKVSIPRAADGTFLYDGTSRHMPEAAGENFSDTVEIGPNPTVDPMTGIAAPTEKLEIKVDWSVDIVPMETIPALASGTPPAQYRRAMNFTNPSAQVKAATQAAINAVLGSGANPADVIQQRTLFEQAINNDPAFQQQCWDWGVQLNVRLAAMAYPPEIVKAIKDLATSGYQVSIAGQRAMEMGEEGRGIALKAQGEAAALASRGAAYARIAGEFIPVADHFIGSIGNAIRGKNLDDEATNPDMPTFDDEATNPRMPTGGPGTS